MARASEKMQRNFPTQNYVMAQTGVNHRQYVGSWLKKKNGSL